MALSGLHVECNRAGANGQLGLVPVVACPPAWTENLTTAGTTALGIPTEASGAGYVFTLTAAAEAWVAIGASPNASANPRFYLPAGVPRDFAASPGDKVAWTAA